MPHPAPGKADKTPKLDPASINRVTSSQERLDHWIGLREENNSIISGGPTWQWLLTSLEHRLDASTITLEQVQALGNSQILIFSAAKELLVSNSAHAAVDSCIEISENIIVEGAKHEMFFEVSL